MNLKKLKREITKIAKSFNCNVMFCDMEHQGLFVKEFRTVLINKNFLYHPTLVNELLTTFFHELAHQFKYDNNIYKNYYQNEQINYKHFSKIAFKAEKETDLIGESLMNQFFPSNNFIKTYYKENKELKSFWKNYLLEQKSIYLNYELLCKKK